MPENNDLLYKIALKKIPKVGSVIAKNLIGYTGGVEAVFKEKRSRLLKIPGVGEQLASNIGDASILTEAEKELQEIQRNNVNVIFYLDDTYPHRLKQYPQCPILIYTRGTIDFNAEKMIALVGTRKASTYGKMMTEKIVSSLAPYRPTIVSGLAYGVDITAHRSCLKENIPTVGVLGSGLGCIYPQAHKSTAMKMLEHGALITECEFNTGPDRENFPARNRIIAGMVDAVIVVESAKRGGSIITAEFANYYNKDVFALPGRVGDLFSEGTNKLIKHHKAHLLENGEDVARLLGWQDAATDSVQRKIFVDLSEEEKLISELLQDKNEKHIDLLGTQSNLPMSVLSSILLSLEFKGVVRSLPGKRYIVV